MPHAEVALLLVALNFTLTPLAGLLERGRPLDQNVSDHTRIHGGAECKSDFSRSWFCCGLRFTGVHLRSLSVLNCSIGQVSLLWIHSIAFSKWTDWLIEPHLPKSQASNCKIGTLQRSVIVMGSSCMSTDSLHWWTTKSTRNGDDK